MRQNGGWVARPMASANFMAKPLNFLGGFYISSIGKHQAETFISGSEMAECGEHIQILFKHIHIHDNALIFWRNSWLGSVVDFYPMWTSVIRQCNPKSQQRKIWRPTKWRKCT